MTTRKLLIAALLGLVLGSPSAKADIFWVAADLVCDAERGIAVARFTTGYNDDQPVYAQLPREIDQGTSTAAAANRRNCALTTGWEIRLRTGSEQGFAYGIGGAAPPRFFSLWVDRRKVMSRLTWLPGYEEAFGAKPRIVAVVVTPSSIAVCRSAENAVSCTSEPLDLERLPIDTAEYPPQAGSRAQSGTIEIPIGKDNALCRSLVRRGTWDELVRSPLIWNSAFAPELQPDIEKFEAIDPSVLTPIEVGSWRKIRGQSFGSLDIDGDGREETIVRIHGESHAFDGTYWIAVDHGTTLHEVEREMFRVDEADPTRDAASTPRRWETYSAGRPGLYPDVLPDFVHLDGYTYRGRVYFLAHPTREKHDPMAMLIRPLAKGRFETVCLFDLVRPNF